MGMLSEGIEILGLIDKVKNSDLYRQLGTYIDKVREQQIENDHLHAEVRDLREQLRFKGSLERIKGHVFTEGDEEELCPHCAEAERRPIHLMRLRNDKGQTRLGCPKCGLISALNYPVTRATVNNPNEE